MCNFFSALVLQNGAVLTHPMLDHHSDLVRYFKLPDATQFLHRFAKVELTPVDWMDVSTWNFRLDEETRPQWWDDIAASAEAELRKRANAMILRDGEHDLIVDGCWIVGGTAKIRDIRSGRIVRVQDTAMLSDVRDSAQVSGVRDSAQVSGVWDSARVSGVGDSARVSGVRGSAQVSGVRGSAQVSDVGGSARVSGVGDSARVSGVRGSAQVSDVGGSAQVSDVAPNVELDETAEAHLVTVTPAAEPSKPKRRTKKAATK